MSSEIIPIDDWFVLEKIGIDTLSFESFFNEIDVKNYIYNNNIYRIPTLYNLTDLNLIRLFKLKEIDINKEIHIDYQQQYSRYMKNKTQWIGDLVITRKKITDLGDLKHIKLGSLHLEYNDSLESLGNIEKVDGTVYINDSKIKTLGNLKYVGGDLNLNSYIKDKGKLRNVKGKIV